MLDEILKEIRGAEAKAEEIINSALDEAKAMSVHAEAEAERIRAEAVSRTKEDRKMVVELAEREAEQKYSEIVELGKKNAAAFSKNVDTGRAIELIKEKVLGRYGDC